MLSSCSNKIIPDLDIDTKEINEYMKYQQCDDNGFADTISLSIIDYYDYYDTYCSLYTLELCGYQLTEAEYTRAVEFLDKINIKELINNEDNLDKVFFYLRISDFLQYTIPDDQLHIAYDYISKLQMKEGFFATSLSDKASIEKGELKLESLSGVDLFNISNILEVSKTHNIKINELNIVNYLKQLVLNNDGHDPAQPNLIQVSALALLIKAQTLWSNLEVDIDLSNANKIYEVEIKSLLENENNYDIGMVYNLSVIGNYLGLNEKDLIKNILYKYYKENGFSPYINTDNNIMATRNALLTFEESSFTLDNVQKDSIINKVLNNQFYDGRFVVGRKNTFYTDRIVDTYNAVLLFDELGELKEYRDDIEKFYYLKLEEKKLEEYSLYDCFYLLSIAFYCDIQIDKNDILGFISEFCNYLEENESIDYQFTISVMETHDYWGIEYSEDIKNKLIMSSDSEKDMENYLTEFMSIYYKYIVYKAFDVEYSSVYEEAINYYNNNFNKLENKIYPARYIARIIRNEQLSADKVSNRAELAQEIDNCTDGILFGFVDDMPGSFDSTQSVLEIIRSLELDKNNE